MKYLVKASFFRRIVAPAVLSILLFLIAVFAFVIPAFERNATEQKKRMLLELTNTAWSILANYQKEVSAGLLDSAEAQTKAMAEVEALRYGPDKKDYFWIIDQKPVMVMHPYVHELMGKSLQDYTDPDGTRPFIEATRIAGESGEGFIRYKWQLKDDSTRIVAKLSFVKAFPDWGWIIGTGVYLDDVEHEIALLTNKLLLILLGITLFIALIISFITLQSLRIENQRQVAERQLHESKEKYRSLVESSTEGILLLLEGRIAYSNYFVQNLLHYSSHELESLAIGDLISGGSTYDFEHNDQESRQELTLKRKDGSAVEVVLTLLPIHFADKDGQLLTLRDVQENRAVKQELEDYRVRFENIANHSNAGIFRFKLRERKITYLNPGIATLLGYRSKESLKDVPLTTIFGNRQTLRELLIEVGSDGVVLKKPVALRMQNSEVTNLILSLFLQRTEDGNAEYCDGLLEKPLHSIASEGLEGLTTIVQHFALLDNAPALQFAENATICHAEATIGQVLETMRQEHSTHALIGMNNVLLGIVTHKDIINRMPETGQPMGLPASTIMTSPVRKAPDHISIPEAMGIMLTEGISHLVLTNHDHQVVGVLHKDRMAATAINPNALFKKAAEACNDAASLGRLRQSLSLLIQSPAGGRGDVQTICSIITAANDAITARIASLAEKELGPAPCRWAFVMFGSAGREELLFSSDQDNGIVYQDVEPEYSESAKKYFLLLGKKICDRLALSGLPYCPGGYMASNPQWCKPFSQWKQNFTQWIAEPEPDKILILSVFFDLRHGYGDKNIFNELEQHIFESFEGKSTFFYLLAQSVANLRPHNPAPGNIINTGLATSDQMDLKNWTAIVVMFARIYALRKDIRSKGTIKRIKALQHENVLSRQTAEEILLHFNYLMQLRIMRQMEDLIHGQQASNTIIPRKLNEIDQLILKKVFSQMGSYQDKLSAEFMSAFKG